ncbi:MAG: 5'/3'-nucleotidase SurE [Candidatus Obscuribacterales bacterium]|nr:5'/3'-nucleotidase SurE [Candidatus Obscuribacterales bacterium]
MKILISNDDGIYARGIQVLAERLAREAEHEVYVVAPDRERSATGHALTLHKPLRVEEIESPGKVKASYWTTGTPSDCVKFAVGNLVPEPVDLVISGINSGPNLGGEILYSGTVSAAMEGAFLDIPSIAVSLGSSGHRHYEVAAEFIVNLVALLPNSPLGRKLFLNVNVPNLPASEIKGVQITKLGVRAYNDRFEKRTDPRGKVYYWLCGEAIEEGEEEGTDAWCMAKHIISVTPISFNMTDMLMKERLESWEPLSKLISAGVGGLEVQSAKKR